MDLQVQRVLSGYKEIASFLGVSEKTIQRYRRSIPFSKIGHKSMILESDLIDWVQKKTKFKFRLNEKRFKSS